jgi:thiamine pyrophosphokinase
VRAAILFAAVPLEPSARLKLRLAQVKDSVVVAADNGATTALAFGLRPDVVIGDLDSLEPGTLASLQQAGVLIETYMRDKNATDGQLAIERALQCRPDELFLVGFLGGPRLDQALANILLLSRIDVPAVLLDERNECLLLRPGVEHTWQPEPGEVISLLPLGGSAIGVTTRGLRWPLNGERLEQGDTRGVSNEPIADEASVSIASGRLFLTRHFPG